VGKRHILCSYHVALVFTLLSPGLCLWTSVSGLCYLHGSMILAAVNQGALIQKLKPCLVRFEKIVWRLVFGIGTSKKKPSFIILRYFKFLLILSLY
jgi:hypothetical protein